jgi:predicted ATP-dependent protease
MPARNVDDLTEEMKALVHGIEIIPIKRAEDVLDHCVLSFDEPSVAVSRRIMKSIAPPSLRSRL